MVVSENADSGELKVGDDVRRKAGRKGGSVRRAGA